MTPSMIIKRRIDKTQVIVRYQLLTEHQQT